MKPNIAAVMVLGSVLGLAGCGPSRQERADRDRARLELEERSRQEAEAANKAITSINQKLGRKPPVLDLGLAPTKSVAPAPEKPKQP